MEDPTTNAADKAANIWRREKIIASVPFLLLWIDDSNAKLVFAKGADFGSRLCRDLRFESRRRDLISHHKYVSHRRI